MSTRLVGGWTHLERQKGGIGLRGPGETQLETDRRLIGERVKLLQRAASRASRAAAPCKAARAAARDVRTVALVGYTNAGKSTLFNRLTGATAYAADQLFATLDTTLRKVYVAGRRRRSCCRTPWASSATCRTTWSPRSASTLTEAADADLILHVIDASSTKRDEQVAAVEPGLGRDRRGDGPADPRAEQDRSCGPCRRASSATAVVPFRRFA